MATQFGSYNQDLGTMIVNTLDPSEESAVSATYNTEDSAIDCNSVAFAAYGMTGNVSTRVRVWTQTIGQTAVQDLILDTTVTVFFDTQLSWYIIPLTVHALVETGNNYLGQEGQAGPTGSSHYDGANNILSMQLSNIDVTDSLGFGRGTIFTFPGIGPAPYFSGAAVYDPSATNIHPVGSETTNRVPTLQYQYINPTSHNLTSEHMYIYTNSGVLIGDSGGQSINVPPGNSRNVSYTSSNFPTLFTELVYGTSYKWRLRIAYFYTDNGFNSERIWRTEINSGSSYHTFSVVTHFPTVNITLPNSGEYDLTPAMQATFNDSLSHTRQETEWQMYLGAALIGQTVPGVNTLTPTYDPSQTSTWLGGSQDLDYGNTYTVKMRALCSDSQWSTWASRNFSIPSYTPTVQNISPNAKIDTLLPTITGTYFSSLSIGKKSHRVQILNADKSSVLGDTNTILDTNTSISETYDNTWFIYSDLQWATTYYVRIYVTDNGDVQGYTDQQFNTDSPPTAPTALSPGGGEEVYSPTPTLYAQFNDPDVGDTPTVMEVELRNATTNALVILRTESDNNETFAVFVADGLVLNETYTWRTRYQDQANLQGSWSTWTNFTLREGLTITLTNPDPDEILTTPVQTFTWTYQHPTGVGQASGRVRIFPSSGALPLYDSGIQQGSYLSQVIPNTLLQNNTTYRVIVDATDNEGQSGTSGYVYFSTSWTGPAQPTGITATANDTEGYVQVQWTPVSISNFVSYRVYRRITSISSTWVLAETISDSIINNYSYYFAPSGETVDYTVVVVEDSTGAPIESQITDYATETVNFPTVTWLNSRADPNVYKLQLSRDPSRSHNLGRIAAYTQPLGRTLPVAHLGIAKNKTISVTFGLILPYQTSLDAIEDFIDRGEAIMYRDGRGKRQWVHLNSYDVTETLPSKATVSLSFLVIDVVEL